MPQPDATLEAVDVSPPREVTKALFRKWRSPRYGTANPERMNNPVWEWLARSRLTAYAATQRLNGPSALEAGPGWCFYRFGQTETVLLDNRRVLIGGEHEDSYDPDFHIYNDVVVLHPEGLIDIFGYPKDIFPPTDFHTATLVGDRIVIIGCLGYPEQRQAGRTPVYSLDLKTFAISPIVTSGTSPGWIHGHTAELAPDSLAIVVRGGRHETSRNVDDWRLQLDNAHWEPLTRRGWQVWRIQREDNKPIHLWQIRIQSMMKSMGDRPEFQKQRALHKELGIPTLEEELGGPIDFEVFSQLFQPAVEHDAVPESGAFGSHRIRIKGVIVSYEEDPKGIEVTFEGELPRELIEMVVEDLHSKLTRLERAGCAAQQA